MDESVLLEHHRAALEEYLSRAEHAEAAPGTPGADEGGTDVESAYSAPPWPGELPELARPPSEGAGAAGVAGRRAAVAEHRLCVTVSVLVYWVAVSLVPVWNKRVMHASRFPYAIATAMIQLGTVAAVLFVGSVVQHYWLDNLLQDSVLGRRWGSRPPPQADAAAAAQRLLPPTPSPAEPSAAEQHYSREAAAVRRSAAAAHAHLPLQPPLSALHQPGSLPGSRRASLGQGAFPPAPLPAVHSGEALCRSWVLGPHLGYKLRAVLPIGLLFGLKYSVTNLGLMLLPTSTHLLLQGTDILWTVAAAALINRERVGRVELWACGLCSAASTLLSLRVGATLSAPLLPLAINLASPLLLGLCISTLRLATVELMRIDGPLKGTMSHGELTCFKLILSSATAGVGAMLVEGLCAQASLGLSAAYGGAARGAPVLPWWTAFSRLGWSDHLALLGGSALVLIFQVNITWLTHLTSAVTVGLVGGVKIVPQWALALLVEHRLDVSPLNILGALLMIAAGTLFTYGRAQRTPRVRLQQAAGAHAPPSGGCGEKRSRSAGHLSAAPKPEAAAAAAAAPSRPRGGPPGQQGQAGKQGGVPKRQKAER